MPFWERLGAYSFIVPGLMILAFLIVIPLFYSAWISLHLVDYESLATGDWAWVGLSNFVSTIGDPSFLGSSWLLLKFIFLSTIIEFVLALGVAYFLDQVLRPPKIVQSLLILPMFVIPVVSGLSFRYIFDPNDGLLGKASAYFNLQAPDFLGTPEGAFVLIILQDVWRMWPFLFIVIFAGFKTIPQEPIDAIKLDGANHWQRFVYLVFPAIKASILVACALKVIESLKCFTEIYVMTGGGPGDSTTVLSMYIVRQMMDFSDFGKSAAASFVLFLTGAAVTFLLAKLRNNRPEATA